MSILWMVIKTLGSLFVVACTLRLYMQWVRLHAQNPISRLTCRMTDWIVLPLRRLLPPLGHFDWACFFAGLLLSLGLALVFYFLMTLQMLGGTSMGSLPSVRPFGWLVVLAVVWMVQWTLQLGVVVLIASVLLGWLSPMHPLRPVFGLLSSPMLAPFQHLLGKTGLSPAKSGFDLSPIGAFLMLQVAAALTASMEAAVMRHLF